MVYHLKNNTMISEKRVPFKMKIFTLFILAILISFSTANAADDSAHEAVGVYVQHENGNFRVAWGPLLGDYEFNGSNSAPNLSVSYQVGRSSGIDEWSTSRKRERWSHLGEIHIIKQKHVERNNNWTVYRILYWTEKGFAAIYFSECPQISYKGLTVWKNPQLDWSIVVEAVKKSGYWSIINQNNLLVKAQSIMVR